MKNTLSGLGWVILYLLFCLAPLVVAWGQDRPPGRPFLVDFSVALGFVGLSILALQFALIARFKVVAAPFGIDALLRYHVQITFVGLAFARHVVYDCYVGGLIFLLVWIRLISPLIRLRHPWRVVRVVAEHGGTNTLVIEPVGHEGFRFDPGQFGWIAVGRSPFAITQHPFSFSCAADTPLGGPVAMTIKAAGDFTKTVPGVTAGTRVYLDGPHGVFSMDRRQAPGYVFIAGGVGVTPMYSMVLTMREREDVRPVTLFYASATWDDVVFREELAELSETMPNLRVVHVLGQPPEGWTGESGYITPDILRRHLPSQYRRYEYLICGSSAMMDAMEEALTAVGVPFRQVSTERFDMV